MRAWILVVLGASAIVAAACSSSSEGSGDDSSANDAGSGFDGSLGDSGSVETCFILPGTYVEHYSVTACDASYCDPNPDGIYAVDDAGAVSFLDGGEPQFDDAGNNMYYGCHVTGGQEDDGGCVTSQECAWGDYGLGWTETQTLTLASDHASLSGTMVKAFNDQFDGGEPLGECDETVKWTRQ